MNGTTQISYENVSKMRNIQTSVNYNRDKWASRAAVIYRKTGDFKAGDGINIPNSGYSKVNVNGGLSRKFGSNKRLNIEYIGDYARNIGYPALIMDARKTDANIASAELKWQPDGKYLHSVDTKIYYNHIGHYMDDFDRNVMHRNVMPMMHMNMFGRTTTMGFNEDMLFSGSTRSLGIHVHYYHLSAFGDMKMISMMKGMSDKYMLNLGDVSLHQIENSVNYNQQLSNRLQWTVEGRYTFSSRNISNSGERSFFENKYGISTPQKNYNIYSVSTSLSTDLLRDTRLQLSLSKAQRVPTRIESYGHQIYNNTDGAFYNGNPGLKPENSYQAQLSLQSEQSNWGFKSDIYVNQLHNHIIGVIVSNNAGKKVKDYENISSAFMWGAEARLWWKFMPNMKLYSNSAYTYGQNISLHEPLPLISPLHGIAGVKYDKDKYDIDFDMHYATKQDRIAHKTTLEDVTHGYTVYNVSASYQIYKEIRLIGGIENLFDRYYHNHLSFGNLPNPGRNIYVTLRVNW
jgi:iron complex outermembrane receptor protein